MILGIYCMKIILRIEKKTFIYLLRLCTWRR